MAQENADVVRMIEADPGKVGALSTGEAITAALLFNRMDWLPPGYEHSLDAIDRLGPKCMSMVMEHHPRQS